MDKIVYVYGSARNAATRVARRAAVPREMQVRLGPWIIRPSRRTAVETVQLAKYEREVIEKVKSGVVQIQNGDTVVYTLDQIQEGFAVLRGTSSAPDFMQMPFAELMELMRGDSPDQQVWDAFVERTLAGDEPGLPDMLTRLSSLSQYAEKNASRLDVRKSLQLIHEAGAKHDADLKAAHEAKQAAEEAAAKAAAAKDQREVETEPPPANETADDPEQMDFTPVPAPEVPTSEPETVEEPAPEVEVDPRAAREAQLPEGWRTFTNAKLAELLTELGIDLPERQNKAGFVAAVEAWLGGS